MKTKLFITAALLCCFAVCLAATGITGNWAGTLKTPDGNEFPLTYSFKDDGGKITGTASSPQGEVAIADAKLTGDDLSFGVPFNDAKIMHTAKYFAAGDSISLDIDFNGQKMHSTLKRADK